MAARRAAMVRWATERMKLSEQISSSYTRPVVEAAMFSAVLLILSFMVLDMGETGYASVYAMAAFWVGVLLIILRRPHSPTKSDLHVIRFGSLVVVIAAQFLARWIWAMRGVSF